MTVTVKEKETMYGEFSNLNKLFEHIFFGNSSSITNCKVFYITLYVITDYILNLMSLSISFVGLMMHHDPNQLTTIKYSTLE